MAKLTDAQLIVLSSAAARDDGIAVVPAKMNRAAASKVGASLVTRKLMREVRSKPGMPVWRKGEDDRSDQPDDHARRSGCDRGRGKAGWRKTLRPSNKQSEEKDAPTREKRSRDASGDKASTDGAAASPRAGTKQALVMEMLCAKKGATLDALIDATGWLPHTTRAALTGLRKRGFSIERTREEGSDSIYRIVSAPAAVA